MWIQTKVLWERLEACAMSPIVIKKTGGLEEPPSAGPGWSGNLGETASAAGGAAPPWLPPRGGLLVSWVSGWLWLPGPWSPSAKFSLSPGGLERGRGKKKVLFQAWGCWIPRSEQWVKEVAAWLWENRRLSLTYVHQPVCTFWEHGSDGHSSLYLLHGPRVKQWARSPGCKLQATLP